MFLELIHDTIAKQVYQKASTEARTRRKVERYISERYDAFQNRAAKLTQDDVDYVWPHIEIVNSKEEELAFVRHGKKKLEQARFRRKIIIGSITLAFALLSIWALWQRNEAIAQEQRSKSMRVSLAARYALGKGQPDLAFRLAEQTLIWNNDSNAEQIAREVLQDIQANPLVRDVIHKDSITSLQFALTGDVFLSASMDGEARISTLKGEILRSFQHDSGVKWARLLKNDQWLLVLTERGVFTLYDLESSTSISTFSAGGHIVDPMISSDQNLLIAAVGKHAKVWKLDQSSDQLVDIEHDTILSSIGILNKGDKWQLLSADKNNRVFLSSSKGERLLTIENPLNTPITNMQMDQNSQWLLFQTASGDFMTDLNGQSLTTDVDTVFMAFQPRHSKFTVNPELDRLVSISYDSNHVYVWNFRPDDSGIDLQFSPKGKAIFATLSLDGHRLLSSSDDKETVIHKIKQQKSEQNEDIFRFYNHTKWGVFAPNHAHFLSSDGTNTALLWKFDLDYVSNKKGINLEQLQAYYQSRIRPLSKEERLFYRLD